MVAYTIPGTIATPISVTTLWATSWKASVLPPMVLTGNPADHQIDNEEIATAVSLFAVWGLDIAGGIQELIATRMRVLGSVGVTHNGGTTATDTRGFNAAGDNELETPVEIFGGSLVQAFIVGAPALIATPVAVTQNFDLFEIYGTREILPPISVLDGDFPLEDTRKSPALVLFNGTNYLTRAVDDAIFDGEDNFSCAVIFDPELVEPGQNCVVVAKNNLGATQAGWKVAWDATTKLVTVTVYSSLNGADRVERTTVAQIVRRSILVWTYDSAGPDLHLHVNQALSEGAQTDTGTPGTMADSTEPLTVGAHETSTTPIGFMKGAVYLVALWDITLSQSEAESIDAHGSLPTALQTGDLIAYWDPLGIDSNGTNDYFNGWLEPGDFELYGRATSGDVPRIMPGNTALDPFIRRNSWTVNFADTSTVRTQNLNSTRVLSNDPPAPLRRIYNVIHTNPNIANASNWRTQQCDLTFIAILYKGQTTNSITVFECFGLRCLFDRPTHTLTLIVGSDSSMTLQNDLYTFPPGGLTGFADNQIVVCVIKYNAVEDKAIAIVNGRRMYGAITATNSFSNAAGLVIGDQIDYIAAIAIPACLSDTQIEQVIQGFQGTGASFTYGFEAVDDVDNRWLPIVDELGDLSAFQAFGQHQVARYTGTDPEPRTPPALFPTLRIRQRSSLLPSVIFGDSVDDLLSFQYVDEPYHVQLGFGLDDPTLQDPIFIDPLPTIVSVTANVAHSVVATANAGPTDAGQVATWWEVELIDGSEEALLQFDYNPANSFAINRNHTDTFTIPVGINLDEKRIRFVIQSVVDGEQIWRSLFFRMEGANFDNHEVEVIVTPGVPQPSPPTIDDLQVTITQSQLVLRREREVAGVTLNISVASRYKLTRAFVDADRDVGAEFELMSVLTDFYTSGETFKRHRVTNVEIGFLDKLAVRFFGPGNEQMWWAIAYANAIIDPETIRPGDELIIPSREAVRTFLARRPVTTG